MAVAPPAVAVEDGRPPTVLELTGAEAPPPCCPCTRADQPHPSRNRENPACPDRRHHVLGCGGHRPAGGPCKRVRAVSATHLGGAGRAPAEYGPRCGADPGRL